MKPRILFLLMTLALAGFGCAKAPSPVPVVNQPTPPAASAAYLSGTTPDGTLDLSLTTAFEKVRGSFTLTKNGTATSGMALGDVTGTHQLVFGLYTGRWDDFAAATGTWQGDSLALHLTLNGQAPMDIVLAPKKGGANFDVVTVTGSDKRTDGSERCSFNFAYPVMHNDNADAVIRKDFGLGATSTAQDLSDEFISRCKSDIDDLLSDTTTADYAKDMAYDSETLFSVERNRGNVISFLIDSYDYEGGAHGMPGIYGVNIDVNAGKSLTLGDLVKRDDLKPLLQKVEAQVLKEYSDALFDEPLANFKKFVADQHPASESELVTFAGLDNFYLTDTGIVFYWNVYEISPYAAGQLTVELPFTDLKDMLRSDAPGASLIQ
jgi:hypothetical protein